MVTVKEVMHSITVVPETASVSEVARIMKRKEIGSVMVEKWGKIAGIVTERDIIKRVVAEGKVGDKVKVGDVATYSLVTVDAGTDIIDANELLHKQNIRRLPVTENGKIIGIVTVRGISKNLPAAYSYLKKRDCALGGEEYGTGSTEGP
ncbi:MAG: CBS domain-containing protein [Candidatus Micrarchaeota archaeon]|nr:CBS domain-containing protein [Candidatus Micrarchaeota archaeon]